jgi:hypothetical protein
MAEGNANRPAPETLTTEDVDRLSERFKPSWETEPQVAPRAEPARPALKQTMLGGTTAAAPPAPARPPAAAPAAPTPIVAVAAPVAAKPMATVTVGKAGLEVAKPVRHPTLVGIAPQAIRQVSGAPPQAAPDDLDWELPVADQPEPASDMARTARIVRTPDAAPPATAEASRIQPVQAEPPPTPAQAPPPAAPVIAGAEADEPLPVDVEELPPESKPSGIGQKYVPPDLNAPAIVLNEEVQRTEAQARATVEAQHRARSAPTIAKMPAVRVPATESAAELADEDTVYPRRRGGRAVWVVLSILTLGGGASLAAVLLRKPEPPPAALEGKVEKPVAAAETAAPPPPVVAAEPPPAAPAVSAVPEPIESAETAPAKAREPAKPVAAAPPVEAPKRAVTPASRPKAKPASTARSGTGSSRPPKSSVIVRDNPF